MPSSRSSGPCPGAAILTGGRLPEGTTFDIVSGEQSIFDQYCAAIGTAQRSIYIENQYLTVPEIVSCLHLACSAVWKSWYCMPAEPDGFGARPVPRTGKPFSKRARPSVPTSISPWRASHASMMMAGARRSTFTPNSCWLMMSWATIGSCNLHRYSLFGNGEMNATIWSPDTVRALRCELFQEHLDQDTSRMDDRTALRFSATSHWKTADGSTQAILTGRAWRSPWIRSAMGDDAGIGAGSRWFRYVGRGG